MTLRHCIECNTVLTHDEQGFCLPCDKAAEKRLQELPSTAASLAEEMVSVKLRCLTCGYAEDYRLHEEHIDSLVNMGDGTYTPPHGECATCLTKDKSMRGF